MSIIADYAETGRRAGGPKMDISKLDGTAGYLRHYSNLLILTFFHTHGTRLERQNAALEMVVCERKLKWWANHENYDHAKAVAGMEKMKREWEHQRAPA